MTTALLTSNDVVVLSEESLQGSGDDDAVGFNIAFVTALFRELLRPSEISRDALISYYVDYYLAQVCNGGFSQFVHNTGWKPEVVSLVKDGLAKAGAAEHANLFEKGEWLVTNEPSKLRKFLAGEYFGANKERDRFDSVTKQFFAIEEATSLRAMNSAWLKARPNLCVVPLSEVRHQINIRAAAIPDLAARKVEALEDAPRYMKQIHALCKATGHSLNRVTAGDPSHEHEGQRALAWHFITDKGHHYMVEAHGKVIMFSGSAGEKIIELAAE